MRDLLPVKQQRIEVVDALRGFAVMAICIVHNLEHFIFPIYPETQPDWLSILNTGVYNVIFSLFAGKAYAIFALLFGFTFYIQYSNQQRRGYDFGYRFLWRLVLLAGFATINAAFFPAGDVLSLFVIVGIILFLARKWSDRTVLIVALLFLLQPYEWFHYFANIINPAHTIPDFGVGPMYEEVAEYTRDGKFWNFILQNITLGQKATLCWALSAGRFWQTAGLFLFGLYVGRKQLFLSNENNTRFWIKALMISAIVFGPLYQIKELMMAESPLIQSTVGIVFDMWQKLTFTVVLVSSFYLLYQTKNFQKAVSNLRTYGKMSLTNYIGQSIMGSLIYFPFGLFLAPYYGYFISALIGIALIIIQIIFCKWWLKSHKQGPLERIWHKLTWLGSNHNIK